MNMAGGNMGNTSAGSTGKKIKIGGVEIDHEAYKQRASEHMQTKVMVIDDVDK